MDLLPLCTGHQANLKCDLGDGREKICRGDFGCERGAERVANCHFVVAVVGRLYFARM